MPTAFLEIVELSDGRIVLRRPEDQDVLVTLEFSASAKSFLQGQQIEVAKAMLDAGVQVVGELVDAAISDTDGQRVLH